MTDFSGRLSSFSVPDLLQWVKADRRSGSLTIRNGHKRKRLLFQEGGLVACFSNDVCDYYGQYLLLHGHIDQGQLFQALAHCRARGTRLGQALADLALLARPTIARTLREQICDSACDLILWHEGIFAFDREAVPSPEEILPEPIDTTQLVMEGALWLDERARFRKVLPHDQVELHRGPAWPGEELSPLQARVTRSLRDRLTFHQIHQLARAVRYRCMEAVVDLVEDQVLRVENVGAAPPDESPEPSLYELLFEDVASQDFLLGEERAVFSLEYFGRMFPVWVHKPREKELARLSPALRYFFNRLDGEAPLRALVAEDRDTRRQQLELLFTEVRRRNVVLFPLRLSALHRRVDPGSSLSSWWLRPEVWESR